MEKSHITIREFEEADLKDVLSLFASTSFDVGSVNPADSVFSSVVSYQSSTGNLGLHRGFVVVDDNLQKIVGFFGRLGMKLRLGEETMLAAQCFGLHILPEYPGHFKSLLKQSIELNDADLYMSVFPVSFTYGSFMKTGYTQVCAKDFTEQTYLVFNLLDFGVEALLKRILKTTLPAGFTMAKLQGALLQTKSSGVNLRCYSANKIPGNLSTIEDFYYKRNYKHIVPEWNSANLQLKYEKNLHQAGEPVGENASIIVCCVNDKNEVCGIAVAKKMRGFNKMILAELQTQEQNHEIIAEALIDALRAEMLKLGFNALMNIRVDDIYTKALSKKYRTITRQAERRIYAYLAGERRYSDVKILYGDDDINF